MWHSQPSDQHVSLGCHTTPPLLRNRHDASQLCSCRSGIRIAHYEKTWRHPQNWKYTVFHCRHRRTEPRLQITRRKFREVWTVVFAIYVSRQRCQDSGSWFQKTGWCILNELLTFYRGPWQLSSRLLLSWHSNADDLRVCNLLHATLSVFTANVQVPLSDFFLHPF